MDENVFLGFTNVCVMFICVFLFENWWNLAKFKQMGNEFVKEDEFFHFVTFVQLHLVILF